MCIFKFIYIIFASIITSFLISGIVAITCLTCQSIVNFAFSYFPTHPYLASVCFLLFIFFSVYFIVAVADSLKDQE